MDVVGGVEFTAPYRQGFTGNVIVFYSEAEGSSSVSLDFDLICATRLNIFK